jgi:very-short-patch-repair endonuclease
MTPSRSIDSFRRDTARRLRKKSTDAEIKLWRHLRQLPMSGSHFRRQVPIGAYVADFACMASKLLIEVDGGQHGEAENASRDEARTRWLEAEGYRVIRFWNNEIINNIDGVMEAIYVAVYGASHAEPMRLKHQRRRASAPSGARPPPAPPASPPPRRRPSPCRGG